MKRYMEEINTLDIEDINKKIESLEKELYGLNYRAETSRVEKPHRFKQLRRQIARCKTAIREKELRNADKR